MVKDDLLRVGINPWDNNSLFVDLAPAALVEEAVDRHEGKLSSTGALVCMTGARSGRSPKDRFIVDTPEVHDRIAWGSVNQPFTVENYAKVKRDVCQYLADRDLFITQAMAGADRRHARSFEIVCERASQALFTQQLLIRPTEEELRVYRPDWMVLAAPGFRCVPAYHGTKSEACVLLNFREKTIIVCGTGYSGEIKKAVFSVMNYLLPIEDNVLPMHCSCNMNPKTRGTTVFFGLSGTGKTTLSAAEGRLLIGDDEHGWSEDSGFNIEGGCYAKCINLDPESEPQIYNAIRFGSVVENVIIDRSTREPDYADATLTENTRVGYPVTFIPNAVEDGMGSKVPDVVIFLTADAFGVLPPISRLDVNGAMYHFITGFTSKVAGTEEGIKEPQPTFSSLFGEPFMPLDPMVYAKMLGERINREGTRVYLINTGWTGGPYGVGSRMKIRYTRKMVSAAMSGAIEEAEFVHDERLNLDIPQSCPGVPAGVMNPRHTWDDPKAYDDAAERLAKMFVDNAQQRHPGMSDEVRAAGPRPITRSRHE